MLRLETWHEQALFAATIPQRVPGGAGQDIGNTPAVRTFSSVAMLYFRDRVVRAELLDAFRHPALDVLRAYDEKHGAPLYETLRTYLENDRNAVATADELYIHRNTLLKRLRKIAALTEIDLDDPNCRKRLLASFAVE